MFKDGFWDLFVNWFLSLQYMNSIQEEEDNIYGVSASLA